MVLIMLNSKWEKALKSTKATGIIQVAFCFCPSPEVLRDMVASLQSLFTNVKTLIGLKKQGLGPASKLRLEID
jgi:hypothetical protein